MILTPLVLDGTGVAGVEPIDTRAEGSRNRLRELYAPPTEHWLRLNLIQSANGSAQGSDGTSETLSNAADRALLGVIRSLADIVLIGAETLRAEDYLLPKRGHLAVLTGTGELGGATADPDGGTRPVVVLGPSSAERRARETLTAADVDYVPLPGSTRVDPADAVTALRDRGARTIVCEGGPRLAVQLLDARLVDEVCLSVSPRLSPGLPVLGDAPAQELDLTGLLVDDSDGLYSRWLIRGR